MSELPTIEQLIDRNALFVVSHSGGKDSQAMLIKLLERIPPAQLLAIHSSLGESEWHGALELAQEQAGAAGLPFLVARASRTLLEMVERRYKVRPGTQAAGQAPAFAFAPATQNARR
jgi:diphthamide synthase (EF-2-diphthine--ammonia ligase)